ncbi:MAG: hypothetical protein JSW58_16955 [Candidatus Latescibacterota bacterium]|nr:MAG: hypothetical protein JSW58_16955 [Candidatus Latescibacterota bacterium]
MPKPSRTVRIILAWAVVAWFTISVAQAEIVLDTAFPIENQTTRIHVIDEKGGAVANADIEITYRPGSAVSAVYNVGQTGNDGTYVWTPREAGIVTISATWTDADGVEQSNTFNASVKYKPTPIAGIVIMILAGIVLIGGSIERIATLLRSPEPD